MARKKLKIGAGFSGSGVEIDMTPMIDMTFQLIAFFMVLINFSEGEQDQRIQLPESVLAKPAAGPSDFPITIHVVQDDKSQEWLASVSGIDKPIADTASLLGSSISDLTSQGKSVKEATIVIRAHKDCPTGRVQEVIQICQKQRFEKFVLRAKDVN